MTCNCAAVRLCASPAGIRTRCSPACSVDVPLTPPGAPIIPDSLHALVIAAMLRLTQKEEGHDHARACSLLSGSAAHAVDCSGTSDGRKESRGGAAWRVAQLRQRSGRDALFPVDANIT